MLRRLRSLIFVVIAAALGAVLGRLALQARQRMDAGEPATAMDMSQVQLRIPDVIPGLIAAFRVKDAPWSWFHIPSWLAAFAVNFGVGAAGGDIAALKERAERMAFDAVGLDAREFGMGGDWEGEDLANERGTHGAPRSDLDATMSPPTPPPAWGSTPPPPPPMGSI